jgi:response regulator RpfG family c-di-GMP phosphodiesterase
LRTITRTTWTFSGPAAQNYAIIVANDGEEALAKATELVPSLPFMPIIMVTAMADSKDVIAGLEAGDDYLTKPVDQAALLPE